MIERNYWATAPTDEMRLKIKLLRLSMERDYLFGRPVPYTKEETEELNKPWDLTVSRRWKND